MGIVDKEPVRRVRAALAAAGSASEPIVLADSAGTAAAALNVALGAIVKSLVFLVDEAPVLALVSGDRRCRAEAVATALDCDGAVRMADARAVKSATGFTIGGVAPVGAATAGLPVVIDEALGRFPVLYAAAGHPHCVFATSLTDLVRLTGGRVAANIAEKPASDEAEPRAV